MFVLLFRYVFGGAIKTPGYSYADFLIPGIIVQNIAFGGFVTALGLNEDLHKGLIDRFRSLPMARPGGARRAHARRRRHERPLGRDPVITGLIDRLLLSHRACCDAIAGFGLLLLFGYAFSWVFAFLGMLVSTPEAANSVGFIAVFPLTFISSAFVPVQSMPEVLRGVRRSQPVHGHRRRDALAVARSSRRKQRLGRVRLGPCDHRGFRAAGGGALPARGWPVTSCGLWRS